MKANKCSYDASYYIDSRTLKWATDEKCPPVFNSYIADILIDTLGIDGSAYLFCRCKAGGYNLGWTLENGNDYIQTFSNQELLNALKDKWVYVELSLKRI